MARFLKQTAALPPSADPSRIRIAEQLFLDWGLLVYASLVCAALPETYAFPSLARVLDGTGGLDLSAVYVRRRLNFTMRMVFDIMNRGGLQARGKGLLAVQRIRVIHAVIRLLVQRKFETSSRLAELSGVERMDGDGLPVNQAELLYTLMTFSHVVLRSFERFGCKLTPFEQESYVHTWNVVGALLGVRESLLPHDVEDARRTFDELPRSTRSPPRPARGSPQHWVPTGSHTCFWCLTKSAWAHQPRDDPVARADDVPLAPVGRSRSFPRWPITCSFASSTSGRISCRTCSETFRTRAGLRRC